MRRPWKTFGFFTVLSGLVSACSSLPFNQEKPVDYNAITYGDDYKERGGDWAPHRVRIDRGNAGSESSDRSVYSMQDTRNDSTSARGIASAPVYEDENRNARLDPSNEQVRSEIAVGRGQAVANYKRGDRATKEDFWDETPNDGSLWSNEQDANYFFTKGKVRGLGDVISIKIEDPFIKQVAEEIKKNLNPAEQEVEMALYLKNNAAAKDDKDIQNYRVVASDDLKSDAATVKERMEKAARWAQVDLSKVIGVAQNDEFRAEIVEKYPNGNFKIRAVKRILYRGASKLVSVIGVAPAADFDDKDAIASGKLYEYKIKIAR